MGPKQLFNLQWKLDGMARNARDVGTLLEPEYPGFARFFAKVANHCEKLASYIRTNDEMPPGGDEIPIRKHVTSVIREGNHITTIRKLKG